MHVQQLAVLLQALHFTKLQWAPDKIAQTLMAHQQKRIVWLFWSVTTPGLEPGISCFVGRRLIHWATRPNCYFSISYALCTTRLIDHQIKHRAGP